MWKRNVWKKYFVSRLDLILSPVIIKLYEKWNKRGILETNEKIFSYHQIRLKTCWKGNDTLNKEGRTNVALFNFAISTSTAFANGCKL